MFSFLRPVAIFVCLAAAGPSASSLLTGAHVASAGAANADVPDALSVSASFALTDPTSQIMLQSTSGGASSGFNGADPRLVSLAFSLPANVALATGANAFVAPAAPDWGPWAALRLSGGSSHVHSPGCKAALPAPFAGRNPITNIEPVIP